jgi:FecR protein
MVRISAHTQTACFSILVLAMALPAQAADDATTPSAGVSKIRIVRLSEVKGAVQLDRNIDRGFEPAMANMPIVEKARLRTEQGVAEVEFEDNSSLRLAPDSEVEFPQLERLATGATVSTIHVLKGTVYASMVKSKAGNGFNLLFGSQKLEVPPATRVRLQANGDQAKLAVLDGEMRIEGPSGVMDVPKKKTVTFELQGQNQPQVAKDMTEEPLDSWDKQAADYHARSASYAALSSSPYSYGVNDMTYYGSFADAGGCGMMWRPYFASAAWDPFANGAWAWYPGAGYSWVSPYPWGWTPYHYGSWSFCPGAGWGWMPGGDWYGLGNTGMIMALTGSGGTLHSLPGRPPRVGEPTIAAVNLRPIVRSGLTSADSFEFRKDSAGLGIPRDGLGKLDKLSRQTVEHGTARTEVYLSAPTMRGEYGGRASNTGVAPQTIHRGPAPSYGAENEGFSGRSGAGPTMRASSPQAAPSAPSASGGPSATAGGHPR